MLGRNGRWWLMLPLVALVAAGCSGILKESVYEDGQQDRWRIQGGESWRTYDRNPLKGDESGIMLKKESTF